MAIHKLDDKEIRSILLKKLHRRKLSCKNTIVIEELDLCQGDARIDIAIINGIAKGIEIKSDKDSLDRLAYQVPVYNKVFDFLEVVIGNTHLTTIFEKVPAWWGISLVEYDKNNRILCKTIRKGIKNHIKDPMSVIQFLWKEEALLMLNQRMQHRSNTSLPRYKIWEKLLEVYQEKEIYNLVYSYLKLRRNWRHVHQSQLNDD